MPQPKLPDLEKTLVDLALGLLRAPRMYPDLVCSDLADDRPEITAESVKVTLHYVEGLLAYGFDINHSALQKAKKWFMVEFPNENKRRIDTTEMTRLEALLLLKAPGQYIEPRLKQLDQQRSLGNKHFLIDQEKLGGSYDTLWALKVMALAGQQNLLNGRITQTQVQRLSARVINEASYDKDLALALRLGYELNGEFRKHQAQTLNQFILTAAQTGGLWGDLDEDTRGIVDDMREKNLSLTDYANRRQIFREVILSTCYVIENLMPLVEDFPELLPSLQKAMKLWWGVFHGSDAMKKLTILFPEPADHLSVLARTLVALQAYLDEELIHWGADRVYEILAEQDSERVAYPQQASIQHALCKWVGLGLSEQPERLRLGMSGTNILRVRPRVWNPMYPDDDEGISIPYASSLVIKSGPLYEIQRERRNYNALPRNIQTCFARVPEPSYIDEWGVAFLILQDLHHYKTLDEMLRRAPETHKALKAEIGPFLMRMHSPQVRPSGQSSGLLWALYLLPMQTNIERMFAYIQNNALLAGNRKANEARVLKEVLLTLMGDLIRRQQTLEQFPTAHMHGDLHSRNIMVRKLKPRQIDLQADQAERDYELDFKLIDLEKLQLEGDAALDGGELLADLKLTADNHMKAKGERQSIEAFISAISEAYLTFGLERGDKTFPIRLQLGEARALLRVAKGRTKAGQSALEDSRRTRARDIAAEILDYAKITAEHLQDVLDLLEQLDEPVKDKR